MPAIHFQNVTKLFYPTRSFGAWCRAPWQKGEPIAALRNVSCDAEPGETLCIMGSNGAGKTTLLKIMAGLVLPTSGTVMIDGQDVRRQSLPRRSRIGFASGERPGFYDRLTGRQNLEFFTALYGLSRAEAQRRIRELLECFAIGSPDQQYQEYSTGMKQRLLLARTLLHDPPILLLDEPTRSLDPSQTAAFYQLIQERLRGKTILWTTHQASEAERVAHHVIVLHRGGIRAAGPLDAVRRGGPLSQVVEPLCRDDA